MHVVSTHIQVPSMSFMAAMVDTVLLCRRRVPPLTRHRLRSRWCPPP